MSEHKVPKHIKFLNTIRNCLGPSMEYGAHPYGVDYRMPVNCTTFKIWGVPVRTTGRGMLAFHRYKKLVNQAERLEKKLEKCLVSLCETMKETEEYFDIELPVSKEELDKFIKEHPGSDRYNPFDGGVYEKRKELEKKAREARRAAEAADAEQRPQNNVTEEQVRISSRSPFRAFSGSEAPWLVFGWAALNRKRRRNRRTGL